MKNLYPASLALLLVARSVSATVLVTEAFDYYPLDPPTSTTKFLRGQNHHSGGTGWAGEWASVVGGLTNNPSSGGVRLDLAEASQPYPVASSLTSVGGRIANTAGDGLSRRELGATLPDEVYFSALINWSTNADFSVRLGNQTQVRWTPFSIDSEGKLRTGGADDFTNIGLSTNFVQLVDGVDYMVVARRTTAGDIRTFVARVIDVSYQGDVFTEPADWDLTNSVQSGVALSHLDVSVAGYDKDSMIDEIRFGTEYADVVGTFQPPYIAYEDFDYGAGINLTLETNNNGYGWTDAWASTGVGGLITSGTGKGLYFGQSPDLVLDGSSHVWSESDRGNERDFDTAVDLASQTLYFTALVRAYGGGASVARMRVEFWDGPGGSGHMRANVGIAEGHLFASPSAFGYLAGDVASNVVAEATTYLLAMKRTGGPGGAISAALITADGNRATLSAEPAWQVTQAGETGVDVSSIRLLSNSADPSNGAGIRIDELRIATNWWPSAVYGMVCEDPFPPPGVEMSLSAGLLDFAWDSLSTRRYDLESRSNLVSGSWSAYGSYTNMAATAPTNTLTGVATDGAVRFYRVMGRE